MTDINIETQNPITRDNIDKLTFGILQTLAEDYGIVPTLADCCDQHVVTIEEVIAALLTVRRALQQSGSWNRLIMDIIG